MSQAGTIGSGSTPPPVTSAQGFFAYCSTTKSNVIGNGALYKILFDTTARNDGSAYNPATGTFTAPQTGLYSFNATIGMDNVSTATTLAILYIGSAISQQNYALGAGAVDALGDALLSSSWIVPMTAGDTMTIQVFSDQPVQNGNITGGPLVANNAYSSFSGFFVGS